MNVDRQAENAVLPFKVACARLDSNVPLASTGDRSKAHLTKLA